METLAYPGYAVERHAPNELDGPWRRAALIAVGIAALELVALIAVLVAIVVRPFSHLHPAAAAAPAPAVVHNVTPMAKPKPAAHQLFTAKALPPARTHVLVLNGNGRSGAAAAEAATLTARGYRIAATGNAPRTDYAATMVMYRPGFVREARLLARGASIHVVAPLDGLRDGRMRTAQLLVILGR